MARMYSARKKGVLALPSASKLLLALTTIKTWATPKTSTPQQISLKRPVLVSANQPKKMGRIYTIIWKDWETALALTVPMPRAPAVC